MGTPRCAVRLYKCYAPFTTCAKPLVKVLWFPLALTDSRLVLCPPRGAHP